MKRLIAQFMSGEKIKLYGKEKYVEIFKNPTFKEIADCKATADCDAVRGVICENGDQYCWRGDVLHDDIKQYVDVNQMRFAVDFSSWVMDCHNKYSMDQLAKFIVDKKSELNKYDPITDNTEFDIYNTIEGFEFRLNFKKIKIYLEEGFDGIITEEDEY